MTDRRFAWWLVWAYPPRFRRDVGLGLVDAIEDRLRAERGAGVPGPIARFRAIGDTARNASGEWTHAFAAVGRSICSTPLRPRGDRKMTDVLRQDVRYALRLWARRPSIAAVSILTLALGIGANTAMFSLVNAVLLHPLPYRDAGRLVSVWGRTASFPRGLVSYDEYRELASSSDALDGVALYLPQSVNLTGSNEPQRLTGIFVTGSFFNVLDLKAARGRLFSEAETAPGSAVPVVVLSRTFWRQRFNERDDAVGSTLTINGNPLTVVGVLEPPEGTDSAPGEGYFIGGDVFVPAGLFPVPGGLAAAGPTLLGLGRLKPGASFAAAAATLDVMTKRLAAANPKAQAGRTLVAEPAEETVIGASRTPLMLLLAAVAVVLLIACVNVSHLLLARAVDRQKEIALRAALGATRAAVTRQLITEAALLAATATVAGAVLGRWAVRGFIGLRPQGISIPQHVPMDGSVLMFTGVIAVVVTIVCGVAPAFRAARADVVGVLQAASRRHSGTGGVLRDVLMVGEMALSVALVAVAVLLVQSLIALQNAPLGFDPANVFTLQFRLPQSKYPRPEDIARFFGAAIDRVRAIPGVESAALVRAVPFSGNGGSTAYVVEGRPAPSPDAMPQARLHFVTPDYFRTMRIPMLRGRDFTDRDDLRAPFVAVVNDTLAKRAWPGEDPIGRRFTAPGSPGTATVVGVVGDAKHYTATEPAAAQIYVSHFQVPMIFCSLVARTSAAPMSIASDVRRAIWSVDKDQPVWAVLTLQEQVDRARGSSRLLAVLLSAFAGIALLLAAVGIYGVTSYAVAQRTHEIGIRLALGAPAGGVVRDILMRGAKLTLIAVAAGIAVAVASARLATAALVGVTPSDPSALAAAAAVLAAIAMVAAYLPARRASRVDPVVALAEE